MPIVMNMLTQIFQSFNAWKRYLMSNSSERPLSSESRRSTSILSAVVRNAALDACQQVENQKSRYSRRGIIIDNPVRKAANYQGKEPLKDKDPRPRSFTTNTPHLGYPASKESTKCSCSSCSREEQSHSETTFMATIPHRNEIVDTGEQSTFSNAKENTACEKTAEVLYQTLASHDSAPGDHDESQPQAGANTLHHHVAWDLGRDIEREEDGKCDVVVQPVHPQVSFETDKTRISNIRAIEVAESRSRQ
jgi:hypothetical protein